MSEKNLHRFFIRNGDEGGVNELAKYITIRRRYLLYGGLVLAIAFISLLGVNFLDSSEASTAPEQIEPEMKILSIEFDPQIVVRDLSYAGEVFKGIQTIHKNSFKISANVQNMTEKTMTNVPVKLTISSVADKTKVLSKEGTIPTLEPGATARISFENIEALGDANGKSATAGQHEMVLAIKANEKGGMSQNTEAKIIFNVDTAVK
jgi:hypothetical protein